MLTELSNAKRIITDYYTKYTNLNTKAANTPYQEQRSYGQTAPGFNPEAIAISGQIAELRETTAAALDVEFTALENRLNQCLLSDLDNLVMSDIKYLKAHGIKSPAELNGYKAKYKDNYRALKLIQEIALNNNLGFEIIDTSEIFKALDIKRRAYMNFLSSPNQYAYILTEDLTGFENQLNAVLGKNFVL